MTQIEKQAELVELTVAEHVATVSFNRPEVLNAVNTETFGRLIDVFDAIADDPEVWCVVLRGSGRAFCVGADQKERPGMSLDAIRRRRRISPQAFSAMRNCPHPVIAQVHGYALGGGLEMALGCDIIVTARDTVMGLIETKRASIPAGGGTQLLPRLIGPARAKELIFTGRTFTGAEALEWGLVSYAVEPDQLEAKVGDLAREITAVAPISNVQAKRAINMSMDLDVANGLQAEAALYERILTTSDRTEALAAYRDKRPPQFRGE